MGKSKTTSPHLASTNTTSATSEQINLNDAHPPRDNAITAFKVVVPAIKSAILKSRKDWDIHEPKMWSRAKGISDNRLVDFDIENDLVEVRSAATSYGTIILGKIRIPAINDNEGEGFVHVRSSPAFMSYWGPTILMNFLPSRIHDPPNRVINE
jgi:hypothetical protein